MGEMRYRSDLTSEELHDQLVALRDTGNGAVVESLQAPFDVEWLMWTPDGGQLAALGLDSMTVWDIGVSTLAPLSIWPPTDALPIENAELADGGVLFALPAGGSTVTDRSGTIRWSIPSGV